MLLAVGCHSMRPTLRLWPWSSFHGVVRFFTKPWGGISHTFTCQQRINTYIHLGRSAPFTQKQTFPFTLSQTGGVIRKKCHPGPTPEPLLFSLCCVEIYSVLSELRNVWNDSRLLPKAERRGNKIICLPLHAHICAKKKKKKKSASHPENGRTVASSEQEAMQ